MLCNGEIILIRNRGHRTFADIRVLLPENTIEIQSVELLPNRFRLHDEVELSIDNNGVIVHTQ